MYLINIDLSAVVMETSVRREVGRTMTYQANNVGSA